MSTPISKNGTNMNKVNCTRFVAIAIATSMMGCAGEEPGTPTEPASNQPGEAQASSGQDARKVRDMLEGAIPVWRGGINASARQITVLASEPELSNTVRSGALKLIHGAEGVGVKESLDGAEKVHFDASRGFWDYISLRSRGSGNFAEKDAVLQANDFARRAGIPMDEVYKTVSTDLVAAPGEGEKRTLGRDVRMLRSVRGVRVWDSGVMMTFGLDGRVSRAKVKWPAFQTDESATLMSRDEAVGRTTEQLIKSGARVNHAGSQLIYRYDEEARVMHPVLVTEVWPTTTQDEQPAVIAVSLTGRAAFGERGLAPSDVEVPPEG